MTSIRTKFLITATVFAVALTGFAFLSSRFSARRGTRDLTASQAELALQFDLAIRKYIGDKVRPLMEQRVAKDEFIPEAMSTSFAARHVFDEVCREFPDYLLRFPSDNPRNPANAAGLEEMKLIQHFRENPNETKWSGFLTMNGREYLVHCIPRRMREGCLHCHGRPEDAPTSLLTRYGSKAGFHRSVGEVAAVDLVGIPMDKVNARAACEARTELTVLSVGVVLLAGAFFFAFRILIDNRLHAITKHFKNVAAQPENLPLSPIVVRGNDEIGVLASAFNSLATRIQGVQASLEKRVHERTANLEAEIAERRRAEEALKTSEMRLKTITDSAQDAILMLDPQGLVSYWNPAAGSILGYTKEEAMGQDLHDLLMPERYLGAYREAMPEFVRTGRGRAVGKTVELSARRKEGQEISVALSLSAVSLNGAWHAVGILRDITAQKRAEETLRASEERFRRFAAASGYGLAMGELTGQLVFVNAATLRIVEEECEEDFTRKKLYQYYNPEDQERLRKEILPIVVEKGRWVGEIPMVSARGNLIPTEQNIFLIRDEQGSPRMVGNIITDITARKQAEDVLRQSRERLEQYAAALESSNRALEESNRLAEAGTRAKSEFLANMSHEIRTPMTAILGYADLLLTEEGIERAPEHRRQAFETIKRNGEHLLAVINGILDLSKVESGKMEIEPVRCSPVQLVAEVVSLMRVRAETKGLRLETDLVGSLPETVCTDPLRLRQVLINLLGNAIKFTDRGEVRIAVRLTQDSSAPRLCFDVMDTGIGMNEEQVKRLFQPFTQVDNSAARKFGGTGLGLGISKRFIEALGGTIEVRSTPDKGSTFTVIIDPGPLGGIPMIEPGEGARIQSPRIAATPEADENELHKRILLAEDGPDNQRLIIALLKRAGADVTAVENGHAAVEAALAAREAGKAFDVILMDMQMPLMDGYAATRRLREQGYRQPIIALTAHAMAEDRQKCLDAGCDDYATKPIDRQRLMTTVARWAAIASADNSTADDAPPLSAAGA